MCVWRWCSDMGGFYTGDCLYRFSFIHIHICVMFSICSSVEVVCVIPVSGLYNMAELV